MKKIVIILTSILIVTSISAQEAKVVFANMPDSITPLLTAVNRADFIDFLESGMKAKVKNKFDGESEMTDLTPSYIRIEMTARSNWQMKLLPVGDEEKVVCVITTTCAPACESAVRFYTTDWQELSPASYFVWPAEDEFYKQPGQEQLYEYTQLRKKADMFLVKAELNGDTDLLSLAYTTPDYMDEEDREKLLNYVRPALLFKWENNKFVSE